MILLFSMGIAILRVGVPPLGGRVGKTLPTKPPKGGTPTSQPKWINLERVFRRQMPDLIVRELWDIKLR